MVPTSDMYLGSFATVSIVGPNTDLSLFVNTSDLIILSGSAVVIWHLFSYYDWAYDSDIIVIDLINSTYLLVLMPLIVQIP